MIKLDTSYSDYVDETDPNYPNGKAIDCSTDESFDGTPILKELVNDVKGALESVVYAAEEKLSGVSGVPDNIAASDFLNALKKLIETPDKAHADLRGPNAHGATVSASASQIITRDSAGRAQVSSPAVAADIANKGWTEDQIGGMAENLVNGDVNFAGKKTFNGSVEMNGPVGGTGFENRLAEKVDPPTKVTKAQYDAMTPEQKAGKYWIITDATGFNQPVIRDDLKAKDTVWSSDKTDSTINNALANYQSKFTHDFDGENVENFIEKLSIWLRDNIAGSFIGSGAFIGVAYYSCYGSTSNTELIFTVDVGTEKYYCRYVYGAERNIKQLVTKNDLTNINQGLL